MLALLKKIYGKLTYSYKNRLSLIFSLCILVPMLFLFIIGFNSFEKNSINYTVVHTSKTQVSKTRIKSRHLN